MDTVGSALAWARQALAGASDSAGLDAQVLLAHVLDSDRAALLAHPERPLTPEQAAAFRALVERGAAGVPLPYLTGHQAFYDLDLIVTPDVLIPRPETEHLIDAALAWAHTHSPAPQPPPHSVERGSQPVSGTRGPKDTSGFVGARLASPRVGQALPLRKTLGEHPRGENSGEGLRVADVGTGSGAIAITLAKHLPGAQVCAIDLSAAALEVARQNAARYDSTQRIEWIQGDLLAPLIEQGRRIDLIAANLPYIDHSELDSLAVARHEPRLALDGGPEGLDLIRRLLIQAPRVLAEGGLLLLEIGAGQGERVRDLALAALPGAQVRIRADYAGLERLVTIERGGDGPNCSG